MKLSDSNMRGLLFLLIAVCLFQIIPAMIYEDSIGGAIPADNIFISSVAIPRNAIKVDIEIWVDLSNGIHPSIILKYDSLPSIESHDKQIVYTDTASKIIIQDLNPTSSILYIGIWGGELLHSYRYFAGSATYTPVGITVTTEVCANSFQFSNEDCKVFPTFALDTGSNFLFSKQIFMTTANHSDSGCSHLDSFSLMIPTDVSDFELVFNVFLHPTARQINTTHLASYSVTLKVELYLDQLNEEANYYFNQTILTPAVGDETKDIEGIAKLSVILPLSGLWRLRYQILVNSTETTDGQGMEMNQLPDMKIVYSFDTTSRPSSSSADYSLLPLSSFLTETGNTVYTTFNPVHYPLQESRPAVFAINYQNKLTDWITNGQSLQIVLKMDYDLLVFNPKNTNISTTANFLRTIQEDSDFIISGRIGNYPFPPVSFRNDDVFYQGQNSFEYLSSEATTSVRVKPFRSQEDGQILMRYRVKFSWTILHPVLENLKDYNQLYLLLSEDVRNNHQSVASNDDWIVRNRTISTFQVVTGYCLPNTCGHGTCTLQAYTITTSVCLCK
jgi:hypothetical protein